MKTRLDQLLVDRGLVESRTQAQALILAGQVTVDGQKRDKPGHSIDDEASVEVAAKLPYVSRGGFKLAAALDHWDIDVTGKLCIDIGSSTGGFTDCLLQRGAAHVWAIDVGKGQLDWKLRNDPRVTVREGVNARHLQPADVTPAAAAAPARFDLAVFDTSFISVTLLIPAVAPLLREHAAMVVLVKPQFEASKEQVGKGGIVRDPAVHQAACERVRASVEALGFQTSLIDSPILGAEGNREFLLYGH